MQFLKRLLLCWALDAHDWTSAAEQGLRPTQNQLSMGQPGFWEYARMYCRRCGRISEHSLEAERQARLRG